MARPASSPMGERGGARHAGGAGARPLLAPFAGGRLRRHPNEPQDRKHEGGRYAQMTPWSLYMLRTRRGSLYAGISTDVDRRLAEHAGGGARAAKALRAQGPLELVYRVELGSLGVALRAERRLKQLPKALKECIVRESPGAEELLQRLGLVAVLRA